MCFCTSSTYKRSVIAFAASKTIMGPFYFVDTLIYSGFTNNDSWATMLGHAPFTNSINDNAYPYVNVALGFGMQNLTAHDTEWVIVPGIRDAVYSYCVSLLFL